jgi:hypothetical protein
LTVGLQPVRSRRKDKRIIMGRVSLFIFITFSIITKTTCGNNGRKEKKAPAWRRAKGPSLQGLYYALTGLEI